MEKGQGKRTDTLQTDKVFTRKEYIERDAAIVAIKNLYPGIPLAKIRLQKWHEENKHFMECELAIERIPAVDVVEVVRCNDCKNCEWKTDTCTYGWCREQNRSMMRHEYCSDGVKRESEHG